MLEKFTWYKQSSYRWQGDTATIYIDPWALPDGEPPADAIFITHAHFDHFSADDLAKVTAEKTITVAPHDVAAELKAGDVRPIKPGETMEVLGMEVASVAAYNVKPDRQDAHPRDNNWVGYLLPLDGTRYYFAGDTDSTPELTSLDADVVFVPVGGTFTMDVFEAAGAVKEIAPRLAVPCHYGFVVGTEGDGPHFVEAIRPTEGRLMTPVHPFEK